jgi:hypothetical protein
MLLSSTTHAHSRWPTDWAHTDTRHQVYSQHRSPANCPPCRTLSKVRHVGLDGTSAHRLARGVLLRGCGSASRSLGSPGALSAHTRSSFDSCVLPCDNDPAARHRPVVRQGRQSTLPCRLQIMVNAVPSFLAHVFDLHVYLFIYHRDICIFHGVLWHPPSTCLILIIDYTYYCTEYWVAIYKMWTHLYCFLL